MYIYEHVIASHYHWSLDEIRQLDLQDFYVHLRICLVREDIEREFQAKLAGATFGDGHNVAEKERVTERKRLKSGALSETKTQSSKLRKEVGSAKITKSGKVVTFDQSEFEEV